MKRALFLVGHTHEAKGAKIYNGSYEWDWNSTVLVSLVTRYSLEASEKANTFEATFKQKTSWSALEDVLEKESDGYDCSIELHLNSFVSEAHGCECLALKGDRASKRLAMHMANAISDEYGIKKRHETGILEISKGDRGFGNLTHLKKFCDASILVEPCFANLPTLEARSIIDNPRAYAMTLYNAVKEYLK